MTPRQILHVDLDAFFASVEQLDFPSYRGKPVIVGGLPGDRRSVVSTASYEARKFRVHSAMPTAKAVQLCPQGIFVRGRMERYHQMSRQVMNIFRQYSPDVQQMSVDEAFIDITGTELLFGSPEKTARNIKEHVLKETGLTVSIGLASNKYLAKIASGMNKPDGLYVIPPGGEERFMLSLPLSKLWGVGSKTRSHLNQMGFYTIEDIHQATLPGLVQLFGEATGSFLYTAVRGGEAADFDEEPKSRSISAENTYSFDLTDRDAISTALLNLSYTVWFRLLSEGFCSKTVHLKIRYEDFSTVSIQETLPRYISSSDDFYERVLSLFDRKFNHTSGIRLLGVGAQNLETGPDCDQKELFDFGEGKKRAVESAVLELQKKDPKNMIKKARQFLSCVLLAAGCTFLAPGNTAVAETIESLIPDGAQSIFSYSENDSSVEFFTEGSWESTVRGSGFVTLSGTGINGLHITPPVYIQKTDLTVWFLLQNHWFFESAFADDFSAKSIATGYMGDDSIKLIRAGNRGISIPDHPVFESLDIHQNSDAYQAPGIMASFGGNSWSADAMMRLEQVQDCSRTWYGQNLISTRTVELNDWVDGHNFTLPEGVAVETVRGIWISRDNGRTLTRLDSDLYLMIPGSRQIQLSNRVNTEGQLVLIEMDMAGKAALDAVWPSLISNLSELFDSATLSLTEYFDVSTPDWISPSDFTFHSYYNQSSSFLVLYRPDAFSPFTDASFYTIPSLSETASLSVAHIITGSQDSESFVRRNSLDADSVSIQPKSPQNSTAFQFPLATRYPFLYLPGRTKESSSSTGISLRISETVPVTVYDIGTNALGESVSVRVNSLSAAAIYEPSSGIVRLSTMPGPFDTVQIFWKERAEDTGTPVFHSSAAITVSSSPSFSLDAGLYTFWPLTSVTSYSTPDQPVEGTILAAAQCSWEKENDFLKFSASSDSAFQFTLPDITGLCRIEGFDHNQSAPFSFGQQKKPLTSEKVQTASLLSGEKSRYGHEIFFSWNEIDTCTVPVTIAQGMDQIINAHTVSLWIRGIADEHCSVELTNTYGFSKKIPLLTAASAEYESFLPADSWQKLEIDLSEQDQRDLAAHPELYLRITSDIPDIPVYGSIALCGDRYALQGISQKIWGSGISDITARVQPPPVPLPSAVHWLSGTEPLYADCCSGIITGLQDSAPDYSGDVTVMAVYESWIPQTAFDQYDSVSFMMMTEDCIDVSPQISVQLLSDDDQVLLEIPITPQELSASDGAWISIDHLFTATEKETLLQTVPVKRILRITIPNDTIIPGHRFTIWYDELTAKGSTGDFFIRNASTVALTMPKLFLISGSVPLLTDTALTFSSDARVAPFNTAHSVFSSSMSLSTASEAFSLDSSFNVTQAQGQLPTPDSFSYTISSPQHDSWASLCSYSFFYSHDFRTSGITRKDHLQISLPLSWINGQITDRFSANLTWRKTGEMQEMSNVLSLTGNSPFGFQLSVIPAVSQEFPSEGEHTWISSLHNEFSYGRNDSVERTASVTLQASAEIQTLKLKPDITISAVHREKVQENYGISNLKTSLSCTGTAGKYNYTAIFSDSTSLKSPAVEPADSTFFSTGITYGNDYETLFHSFPILSESSIFLSGFSHPTAEKKIMEKIGFDTILTHQQDISISFSRPASFLFSDVFIPSSARISFGTKKHLTSIDLSKAISVQGTLSFSAFNICTAFSQDELHSWYSVQYDDYGWKLQSYLSEIFILKNMNQIRISSDNYFSAVQKEYLQSASYVHTKDGSVPGSSNIHEEQCAFLYSSSEKKGTTKKIELQHSSSIPLSEKMTVSGTLQLWYQSSGSNQLTRILGGSASIGGRIQF